MTHEILVRELREYAESGKSLVDGCRLSLSAASAIEILDRLCDWYEAENKKLTEALRDSFAIDLMDRLEKAERERDAAVKDLEEAIRLYRDDEGWTLLCKFCSVTNSDCSNECRFKWRGVQEEDQNEMA